MQARTKKHVSNNGHDGFAQPEGKKTDCIKWSAWKTSLAVVIDLSQSLEVN